MAQGARGHPGVLRRYWTPLPIPFSADVRPNLRGGIVIAQNLKTAQPFLQLCPALFAPVSHLSPLIQLGNCLERHTRHFPPGERDNVRRDYSEGTRSSSVCATLRAELRDRPFARVAELIFPVATRWLPIRYPLSSLAGSSRLTEPVFPPTSRALWAG